MHKKICNLSIYKKMITYKILIYLLKENTLTQNSEHTLLLVYDLLHFWKIKI